jgi:hypothetical protein
MEYDENSQLFTHPNFEPISKTEIWNRLKILKDRQITRDIRYFSQPYINFMLDYLANLENMPKKSGRAACKKFVDWILDMAMSLELCYGGALEFLFIIYSFHPELVRTMIAEKYRLFGIVIKNLRDGEKDLSMPKHLLSCFFRFFVVYIYNAGIFIETDNLDVGREMINSGAMTPSIEKVILMANMIGFDLKHPLFIYSLTVYQIEKVNPSLTFTRLGNTVYHRIMRDVIISGDKIDMEHPYMHESHYITDHCRCRVWRDQVDDAYVCKKCDIGRMIEDSRHIAKFEGTLFTILKSSLNF